MRGIRSGFPALLTIAAAALLACAGYAAPQRQEKGSELRSSYVLGAEDEIAIRALDAEEITEKPVRIDLNGYIRLPLIGRVRAAGLTIEQLEAELNVCLKPYIRKPEVAVSVVDFRSQPVSVLGCVKNPGVHQVRGRKTLVEMLSLAGGLSEDAGPVVKITRRLEWGRIPLPDAAKDSTGEFSIAEVKLKSILSASNPEHNIVVLPYDVLSVPRAEMIYVTGQVIRSGGFVLHEKESMSVLQAVTLAGGLERTAAPQNARILRPSSSGANRVEIAVDLRRILAGRGEDVPMLPEDILFVPSSAPKKAALRAVETAIQVGTGVVIWRR